jgi:hypothetical protein
MAAVSARETNASIPRSGPEVWPKGRMERN